MARPAYQTGSPTGGTEQDGGGCRYRTCAGRPPWPWGSNPAPCRSVNPPKYRRWDSNPELPRSERGVSNRKLDYDGLMPILGSRVGNGIRTRPTAMATPRATADTTPTKWSPPPGPTRAIPPYQGETDAGPEGLAGEAGFEPAPSGSKPGMLPLHHSPSVEPPAGIEPTT